MNYTILAKAEPRSDPWTPIVFSGDLVLPLKRPEPQCKGWTLCKIREIGWKDFEAIPFPVSAADCKKSCRTCGASSFATTRSISGLLEWDSREAVSRLVDHVNLLEYQKGSVYRWECVYAYSGKSEVSSPPKGRGPQTIKVILQRLSQEFRELEPCGQIGKFGKQRPKTWIPSTTFGVPRHAPTRILEESFHGFSHRDGKDEEHIPEDEEILSEAEEGLTDIDEDAMSMEDDEELSEDEFMGGELGDDETDNTSMTSYIRVPASIRSI